MMDDAAYIKRTLRCSDDFFHALALIDKRVKFEDVKDNKEIMDLLMEKQIDQMENTDGYLQDLEYFGNGVGESVYFSPTYKTSFWEWIKKNRFSLADMDKYPSCYKDYYRSYLDGCVIYEIYNDKGELVDEVGYPEAEDKDFYIRKRTKSQRSK